jgi:hypothetical protein
VAFIRCSFLTPQQAGLIPPEVAAPDDPLLLLVYASLRGQQVDVRRMWSCAVLKVMHGIFYIDNNLKLRHFHAIRASIRHAGRGDPPRRRAALPDRRRSLPAAAALRPQGQQGPQQHPAQAAAKAAYLAADIFDHLGVRLVFATRCECLLALRTLQRAHLLSVTNVDAERTRNTLLDLDAAKQVFCKYRAQLEHSKTIRWTCCGKWMPNWPRSPSRKPAATIRTAASASTASR